MIVHLAFLSWLATFYHSMIYVGPLCSGLLKIGFLSQRVLLKKLILEVRGFLAPPHRGVSPSFLTAKCAQHDSMPMIEGARQAKFRFSPLTLSCSIGAFCRLWRFSQNLRGNRP
jgi:hypothetical protein